MPVKWIYSPKGLLKANKIYLVIVHYDIDKCFKFMKIHLLGDMDTDIHFRNFIFEAHTFLKTLLAYFADLFVSCITYAFNVGILSLMLHFDHIVTVSLQGLSITFD
ncbi:hypothetical protein VIBNISO65_270044 [Vibrio nigripulchritudo SO65]|nr:hypothetical protein VIBNIAM115_1380003 [Vibrio nigripulchritudo AM115]CCN40538.1 hypothetical protein VIBNIFTn2_1330043 [Vibrio nigripulchritudo FTn2]CCN63664.1 hypothetical protein VIBNIPon4_140043 [Vibrio nigripulchritudo POn4]CCN77624.1 hypothetical protein VIBNISO65_270044 [Vibrio nigripulchritudo SO65]